jgi:chromosome partitioning protein
VRTIVVASQKGGVGKTTLCGHLAVAIEHRKEGRAALLDTDPQGGLAAWWNARANHSPAFFKVADAGLRATLNALADRGFAYALIDTPPAITASIAATIAEADVVLIPTKPSPHDLRAVGATVELVTRAGKPMTFIVNQAIRNANLTQDAITTLSEFGPIAGVVHHRLDFVSSMIDGRTAQEVRASSDAAREIAKLWTTLAERINRSTQNVPNAS